MDYKDMTFWDAIKYLPTRVVNAISKLLGIKGIVLYITYSMITNKHIPESGIVYVWIFIVLIVVFGREALTFIKDLKK